MNTVQNKYKPKAKVLVAEDDTAIAKTIEYNLLKEGYEVYIVNDGDNVMDYAKVILPDVILVDWMLPGMQGTTICSLLRADQSTANTPIIMISSKDAELDKVVGLEHGADDYITKPISPIELAARIKAILRRIRPSFVEKKLNYSNIEIDLNACSVYRNGYELKLSPIEFQILHVLVEYPKKVFSREALIERIWGDEADVDERTIDVHITRLRKHLMKFGDDVIKTVRMIGYKLD
jgi:two-component system phosphate regulon response regulator PhoB